jgi:hypothetical protein
MFLGLSFFSAYETHEMRLFLSRMAEPEMERVAKDTRQARLIFVFDIILNYQSHRLSF